MEDIKKLTKTAGSIRDVLVRMRHSRHLEMLRQLSKFNGKLTEICLEYRRYEIAVAKRWYSAATQSSNSLDRTVSEIQQHGRVVNAMMRQKHRELPTLSMLVSELTALEQEFGQVVLDREPRAIAVTTDAITLDGIYLGPFEIQLSILSLDSLYSRSPYRVIALEPNPAASDELVTHPHVNGENVCEGDGSAAIRAALEEGRIVDFFAMIRSILNTYNPDSPYVALGDWEGEPCYDCGYVMDLENRYWCHSCDRAFCDECSTFCRECEETVCLSCTSQCPVCGESFCRRCLKSCAECGSEVCSQCIEADLCDNCREEKEHDHEEEQAEERTSEEKEQATMAGPKEGACPEVQPPCMGETPVLPGQVRQRGRRFRSNQQ